MLVFHKIFGCGQEFKFGYSAAITAFRTEQKIQVAPEDLHEALQTHDLAAELYLEMQKAVIFATYINSEAFCLVTN